MNAEERKIKVEDTCVEMFELVKEFKKEKLGNPLLYNRGYEFIQSEFHNCTLCPVGGGSDAFLKDDPSQTVEFKATKYLGLSANGNEKSHSFAYNGTSRYDNLQEQEHYCRNKIMRDKYHLWSIIDYEQGTILKTIKLLSEDVFEVLWPKWKLSFENPSAKDPRIGASISTNELDKYNIKYEIEYPSTKNLSLLGKRVLNLIKVSNELGLGNLFNFNRGFEIMQSQLLGYVPCQVGGGSDAYKADDPSVTAEFKATEFGGYTKTGKEKSHSFSYNGTSRYDTLSEQKDYCFDKIMRDSYHYWSIIDYANGNFVKTLKLTSSEVWKALWPKWEKSFYNPGAKDPRIGGSVSTNELEKNNIQYEIITH